MKTNSIGKSFTIEKILKIDFQNFHISWEASKSISWTFISSLHNETIVKYAFDEMLWKKYFTVYPRFKIITGSNEQHYCSPYLKYFHFYFLCLLSNNKYMNYFLKKLSLSTSCSSHSFHMFFNNSTWITHTYLIKAVFHSAQKSKQTKNSVMIFLSACAV